jgi:hypothetical protein
VGAAALLPPVRSEVRGMTDSIAVRTGLAGPKIRVRKVSTMPRLFTYSSRPSGAGPVPYWPRSRLRQLYPSGA